jgi:WD40 repeat protein
MKLQKFPIKSFAVPVLLAAMLGAGAGSAAEPPVPWHIQKAEVRIPLTASFEEALNQMPPDVYLADLNPVETNGLSFDPVTKNAVTRDANTPEEKAKIIADRQQWCKERGQEYKPDFYQPNWQAASGSATFALKPEYKWFSFWSKDSMKVSVDGQVIHDGGADPRRAFALPPDGKLLKIEGTGRWISLAGFITRSPAVASATLYLPGSDPTSLIPIVHRLSGEQVGCRILWAYPGEPMSILFDCSSGEKQYMVYLLDRSKNPTRLDWAPKAGLIQESRYLDRYDPAVETVEGYEKLWNSAGFIAGKRDPRIDLEGHGRESVIFSGVLPFRPLFEDWPYYFDITCQVPLTLTRYTGFFHVPATRKYHFFFMALRGGYLLVDNQLVTALCYDDASAIRTMGGNAHKEFEVVLEKGLHQLDFCQYGSGGQIYASLCWRQPINGIPHDRQEWRDVVVFGSGTAVWEPMAKAAAGAMAHRTKKPFASFTWRYANLEWAGRYPARDIIRHSFTGILSEERPNAVFRWRFDDGHGAEGATYDHCFFSPGQRQVQLDVLDGAGGKVIASAAGNVHVQMYWLQPMTHQTMTGGPLLNEGSIELRAKEFATVTPIEEVVSLCYWSRRDETIGCKKAIDSALAQRADELIDKYPYTRLLELAEFLGAPTGAHHDATEKLLRAVMERAPAGSRQWRSAALGMAEPLVSVRAKPESGLELLEKLKRTVPALDMTGNWRTAEAKQWYSLTAADDITGILNGLSWTNALFPLSVTLEGGLGLWLAKDFDLPASWTGKELVLELGAMPRIGVMWFNGRRLGEPWQWPDGNIVIPAGMLRRGGKNQFVALFQSTEPPSLFNNMSVSALSADFKRVATARPDHTVKLQDIATGKERFTLKGHGDKVVSVAFSPDGSRLASASEDGTVRLWDTGTGKELFTLGDKAQSVAFSPDGKRLASGSNSAVIKLWDTATGKELLTLKGHSSGVHAVTFSPDGSRLASVSEDRIVKLWDTGTGKEMFTLWHGKPYMAFSSDGKRLASGNNSGAIKLWDTTTGKELFTLSGHGSDVFSVAFSPDGSRLASGSDDGTIKIWDTGAGKELRTLKVHSDCVRSMAFSPDGKRLASVSRDLIIFWDEDSAHELCLAKTHGYKMNPVTVSVSGPPGTPTEGYTFPMVFYTSAACSEQGVNYAYYEGKWEKLPDFDKMEPVKTGKLKHVDLSPRQRDENFGMKFTAYLKVLSAGVYNFALKSDNGSRLCIDSKIVVDNDGNDTYDARGEIRLAEGIYPVTLTYFNSHAAFGLNITLPNTVIAAEAAAAKRITAEALVAMGKTEQAKEMLMNLKPDAWPIDDTTQVQLASDLRKIPRMAQGNDADLSASFQLLDSWLSRHPMLRTEPGFMLMKMEALAAVGDDARALTLAGQLGRMALNQTQREQWILVQVKVALKAGKMDAARDGYTQLKKIAPYSAATVEAREAITKAVRGKKME